MQDNKTLTLIKVAIFSIIGIFLFFININIAGKSTIGIDHIVSFFLTHTRTLAIIVVFLIMIYGLGTAYRVLSKQFSVTGLIFTLIRTFGLILAGLYIANIGYEWMMHPSMLPFLFNKLTLAVGILIPIGAIGLTFLISFGLIEFVGVFLEGFMRPVFRTPGSSAIDALASFLGSYSIGLLITSNMYEKKKYTLKESIIVATGFSTVSVTFMVVVAKTLGLLASWNFFFWSTLIITFLITAITAYIPPISRVQEEKKEEVVSKESKLTRAINNCLEINKQNKPFLNLLWDNFRLGIDMAGVITTSVISIGFIGLVIANYTPVFEIIGYVFKPFFYLTFIDDIVQVSGKIISGASEMFLPAILLKNESLGIRYMAAVIPISSVIFLSGTLPCILSTKIPINTVQLVSIWFIRTVLSILLAGFFYHLGIYFDLLH